MIDFIEKNKKAYNNWASTYDDGNNPHIIMEHNLVLDMISAKEGDKILDAGCGTGKYTIEFFNLKADVIGCDFSEEMLKQAKKKNNKIIYNIVDLSKKLPYKNCEFNKINCSQVLKHIKDLNNSFKEFYRILKKDGIFVFSVTHPDRPREMYKFKKEISFNLAEKSDIFQHRFFDYIEAINSVGFKIEKINQIVLNDDVKYLIEETDFNKMKGRPEIIIFKLKK